MKKVSNRMGKNRVLLIKKYLRNQQEENINDLLIDNIHYSDATEMIKNLSTDLQINFFDLISAEYGALVLAELDSVIRKDIIYALDDDKLKEIFMLLAIDDKLEIINNLNQSFGEKIVDLLPDRDEVKRLLRYDSDSAANKMNTSFIKTGPEETVKSTTKSIKNQDQDAETIYYLYVLDDDKLIGVLSLRELLMEEPDVKIKELMKTDVISIDLDTDQEEAAHLMTKYDLISLPVINESGKMLGILTIDDIVDVIQEEETEDIFKRAGFSQFEQQEADYSSNLIYGSLFNVVKTRLPWLIVVLFGGLIAGGVIEHFEASLESIVALSFFIPVIMDMGGNVGTQSSTIFVRGLVLGHIDIKEFSRYLKKEALAGGSIGFISAFLLGVSSYLWQGDISLALTTSTAIFLTIFLASLLGYIIPFILVKLGRDSAAASDPLITTIKDITGLIIYFTLASLFMGI